MVRLYHGTTQEDAGRIMSSGFTEQEGDEAQFGRGVYMHSNPAVASDYGEALVYVDMSSGLTMMPSFNDFGDAQEYLDYLSSSLRGDVLGSGFAGAYRPVRNTGYIEAVVYDVPFLNALARHKEYVD